MSIKQSSKGTKEASPLDGALRSCWHREREGLCLTLEMADDTTFVFPYQQFLHAQYSRAERDEILKISFSTHEVLIVGSQLKDIADALKVLAVERISVLPARYRELSEGGEPWIANIDVKALD